MKARKGQKPGAPETPTHNMHGSLSRDADEEQCEDENYVTNAASLNDWIKVGEERRKQKEQQKMMRVIHRKINKDAKKKDVSTEMQEGTKRTTRTFQMCQR